MTIRLSSGMRDAVISNHGVGATLANGYIQVYSGPQPDSPDMPPTGTLLGIITQEGAGEPTPYAPEGRLRLQLAEEVGAICNSGDWVYTGVAGGTPGWWRYRLLSDGGEASTTKCRLDGAVEDSFIPALPSSSPGATVPIISFTLVLPFQ